MTIVGELLSRHHERISSFPAPLEEHFETGLRALAPRLTPSQLQIWAETGVEMTGLSLRSWEAALEYFRTGEQLPTNMTWDALETLGREALAIAGDSAPLAVALLRSAPETIETVGPNHVRQWADLGRRLYKGNWKSSSLSGQFFELSPALFSSLRMSQAGRLVTFVDELSRHSYELAAACLAQSPRVLTNLDEDDRVGFLTFAGDLAQSSWADSRLFFERGAALVNKVHAPVRERFLALSTQVARGHARSAFQYFEEAANGIAELEPDDHMSVVELAEQLAPYSPPAAMEFIANVPTVLSRIRLDELESWQQSGLRILQSSQDGGEAYFRLQSTRGEDVLDTLSARVELSRVGEVLRLYCKALTGRNVSVQTTEALAEKGIGWVNEQRATTEGTAIYLPLVMERFHNKDENFAAVKVFATFQAAYIEFGSFELDPDRPPVVLRRPGAEGASHEQSGGVTAMERFYDRFSDRQLISDLFTIAEAQRVDAAIKRDYAGVRRPLSRLQQLELEQRPDPHDLPLREAFVENLVRVSLDGASLVRWPQSRAETMAGAMRLMELLRSPEATVEDAAEAAQRLYQVAAAMPNIHADDLLQEEWEAVEPAGDALPGDGDEGDGEGGMQMDMGDGGAEEDYESPQEVDFRGDFKPELVQLLMKMRDDASAKPGEGQPVPLTPEQLQELLEKSTEINLDSMMDADIDSTTGLFMSNLMKEAGTPAQEAQGESSSDSSMPGEGDEAGLEPVVTVYYYDEWDFRAQDYKPRWCAVKEAKLEEGDDDFYEGALREHAGLVSQTRKQFELMKPELFRKLKRLPDGEDIDLDAAVEWMVDHRAGVNPSEKIYWRRNKIERDVAVAFLIDMSASTDEEINKRERKPEDDEFDDDPRKYLSWWVARQRNELGAPPKRIIDLERESTVLLMTALETIGDQYGIYGFSGYGRDNVEFFVVKDFDETLDVHIKNRLDKVTPIRSTRMGPAIRHATHKLDMTDAKVKILFLLSDGRPQDHGYGRDRTEKDYAIHDTKQALNEAKRIGITPFCLTVDRAGHDYLKTMCEDIGYEVVGDIEALPSRLPALYRRLTE